MCRYMYACTMIYTCFGTKQGQFTLFWLVWKWGSGLSANYIAGYQGIITSLFGVIKWSILAWTASVTRGIYDQFGRWFCPTLGGQNNQELVINTPNLYKWWVLKFHSKIWHRDKWDFTSISNAWNLIPLPNVNESTTFLSEISQKTHLIYVKMAIIAQIWHRSKFNMPYISAAHGTWSWYSNEENPSGHHGRMDKDGHLNGNRCMDWWTRPFPIFHTSTYVEEWVIT